MAGDPLREAMALATRFATSAWPPANSMVLANPWGASLPAAAPAAGAPSGATSASTSDRNSRSVRWRRLELLSSAFSTTRSTSGLRAASGRRWLGASGGLETCSSITVSGVPWNGGSPVIR